MKVRKSWTEEILDPQLRGRGRLMDAKVRRFFAEGGSVLSGYRSPCVEVVVAHGCTHYVAVHPGEQILRAGLPPSIAFHPARLARMNWGRPPALVLFDIAG